MSHLHRTGHCIVCSKPVFEIKELYRTGEMKGYPKKIGRPYPVARRCEVVLMDGSTTDWTSCIDCADQIDVNLPHLWRKVLRTFRFMHDHAEERGIRAYTSEQILGFNREMQALAVNLPLGVRNVRDWAEILAA